MFRKNTEHEEATQHCIYRNHFTFKEKYAKNAVNNRIFEDLYAKLLHIFSNFIFVYLPYPIMTKQKPYVITYLICKTNLLQKLICHISISNQN